MKADEIRCENDLRLYEKLLADQDVIRVNKQLERMQANQARMGTRRHLLATSVRLSRSMAKDLHRQADECIEKLGLEIPLELYAFSSPQFNAACFKPEEGRLFVMFSSSLLEAFTEKELLFVMGHELGHHVYRHHDIPIGYILRGKQPPPAHLALELFVWSRYAEVSADRAGAYCAQDLQSVARALFKLASGVTSERVVQFSLDDFLAQVDDMLAVDAEPGQGAPMQDWFSTHPFSPLRVKALTHFDESILMKEGGFDKSSLEVKVQSTMSLMEPDYLQGKTEANKAMRRLFVAAAIAVADARSGISEEERKVLERFLDDIDLDKLDSDRLRERLPKRIESVLNLTSSSQRMQVMRDLCLVAHADGEAHEEEIAVLSEVAKGLELPETFVCQCLEDTLELD
jgi:tellurite resistance protein